MLDIDDTDDPVHGKQELALFNAHYGCTCFQPIHIFDGLSGKPVLSLLRPRERQYEKHKHLVFPIKPIYPPGYKPR